MIDNGRVMRLLGSRGDLRKFMTDLEGIPGRTEVNGLIILGCPGMSLMVGEMGQTPYMQILIHQNHIQPVKTSKDLADILLDSVQVMVDGAWDKDTPDILQMSICDMIRAAEFWLDEKTEHILGDIKRKEKKRWFALNQNLDTLMVTIGDLTEQFKFSPKQLEKKP